MARSDVDVCNLAIGKTGGEPIEAIGEDSPLGVFCQLNYPAKRDTLLGLYDWRFATVFAPLNRVTPAPAGTPKANLFAPPADLIGDFRAFRSGPSVDDPLVGDVLVSAIGVASDCAALWGEYTARKPEAAWPVWFVELAATAYAADLAQRRPNKALADSLYAKAFGTPEQGGQGGLLLAAMQADSRNAPQRQLFACEPGALIEARLGCGVAALGLFGRPIIVYTGDPPA